VEHALAQANIARMVAPLDDPVMADFVRQLEFINSVADQSPGFIWRLQTEDGDATAIRAFEDDRILFNMSVWESIESLYAYVYRSEHLQPLRSRRQWFQRIDGPHLVLWWIPTGHRPSVAEAKERLILLAATGPCPQAFTFREPFSPGGDRLESTRRADWAFCG
jgi:hypothetical protein